MIKRIFTYLLIIVFGVSCRSDERGEIIVPATWTKVTSGVATGNIKGFFLLNEGNMGSNKATIDYFDYGSGYYIKNIFAEVNPSVVKELGDVGNDIQIYGNRLYSVINCSHFVEVMDVVTAKHLGTVSIPNCRYIVFDSGFAYVSSYAGPVQIDPNSRLGYVAKVDTATMKVVAECPVGYQPEQMSIVNGKLYVANSGGYRVPNYDTRVSVIDLASFTEIKQIEVGINLHGMESDGKGNLYVSSRGDYYNTPSSTYIIDTKTDVATPYPTPLPNSNMTFSNGFLYVLSTQWSYVTNSNVINYAKIDTRSQQLVTNNFISDGTQSKIKLPYGIAVNEENGEFLVTDAKNYVIPGTLHCYREDGTLKWSVETGDIPAHIVFTTKALRIKHLNN